MPEDSSSLETVIEAPEGATGRTWRVVVIRSGTSINGNYWPAKLLREHAGRFEGVWVYADHDPPRERQEYPVRRIRDRVGFLTQPEVVELPDGEVQVEALFNVIDPVLRESIRNALELGRHDFVQFSINAIGDGEPAIMGGKRVNKVSTLQAVRSVDAVTSASAGGRLMSLVASAVSPGDSSMTPEEIAAIAAAVEERLKASASDSEEVEDPQEEETTTPAEPTAEPESNDDNDSNVTEAVRSLQEQLDAMRLASERALTLSRITEALREANLHELAGQRVRELLEAEASRGPLTDKRIEEAIAAERKLAAAYAQPATRSAGRITGVTDASDKFYKRMQGLFDGEDVDGLPRFQSLRQSYAEWSGDVSALDAECVDGMAESLQGAKYKSWKDHGRLQESLSTASWGEIMDDVFYLKLQKEYKGHPQYDEWRRFASEIEPVSDFRTRHWARVGGYGDLPVVGEGAPYQAATSPTDEESDYVIQKRGMLEASITFEMIANDRVGAVRRVPGELARAAKRTLYKFVMDLLTGNPVMDYDATTLYHTNHANTGTTALSVAAMNLIEIAMASQTAALNASEILGDRNLPHTVVGPRKLRNRAQRLFSPSAAYQAALTTIDSDTQLDPHQYAESGISYVVYDYLPTSPNGDSYWTFADPKMVDILVMGFYGGRQEPEIWTQSDPTVGSGFDSDTQRIKIRHMYGGVIVDHRGCYRMVV